MLNRRTINNKVVTVKLEDRGRLSTFSEQKSTAAGTTGRCDRGRRTCRRGHEVEIREYSEYRYNNSKPESET